MDMLKNLKFKQVFPWVLVVGGIIGLLASSILTIEKMHVLANPDYQPSCSMSPVVACSPVMNSWQASTFKFPNMFIGLAGFAMVWAVGMMLFAGAKDLKKWFWWCFQAGTLFGAFFITWLQIASLYDIQKLCIYCMAVWAVTVPIFWTTTAYNLQEKNMSLPKKISDFLSNNSGKMIALHYLLVILLIFFEFKEYWYSII
ncbi:vitamin K epoxide reductase family protein [Candidatus Saccharibacteria bacterium]|nr:vitamin K epoxide reductase family protein [Candidatus Saccharibacteria bacterium]